MSPGVLFYIEIVQVTPAYCQGISKFVRKFQNLSGKLEILNIVRGNEVLSGKNEHILQNLYIHIFWVGNIKGLEIFSHYSVTVFKDMLCEEWAMMT